MKEKKHRIIFAVTYALGGIALYGGTFALCHIFSCDTHVIPSAITIFVFIVAFPFIEPWALRRLNRILPSKQIDYQRFLRTFSSVLMTIVDLDKLSEVIVNTLYDFYELAGAGVMLFDEKQRLYVIKYACGAIPKQFPLSIDNMLVRTFNQKNEIILRSDARERNLDGIIAVFDEMHAEMCIPLIFKSNLFGLLFLGRKKANEDFSQEDRDSFFTLESQISVAFNNAILFRSQKEAHLLLAQKNQMDAIIALSSGINHEINNPLSIISMRCQNFLRKLSIGKFLTTNEILKTAQEVIESSLRNAKRAHVITKRLSNFAKPIQDEMNIQPVSVKECVFECIDLIGKKQFYGDNITLVINIPDTISDVFADKVQFQQSLYNLIMNAYHAIEKNGTITFRAYEKGSTKIVLEISDTGCGISDEYINKIWDPFFTTKPTNPLPGQKATGSGLGLPLVKRYIESIGGSVGVRSEEGKGSVFFLSLIKVSERRDDA